LNEGAAVEWVRGEIAPYRLYGQCEGSVNRDLGDSRLALRPASGAVLDIE